MVAAVVVPYLIVGDEDELKDEDESDEGGPGGREAKTGVHILLLHEEAKHDQAQEDVDLQRQSSGVTRRPALHSMV